MMCCLHSSLLTPTYTYTRLLSQPQDEAQDWAVGAQSWTLPLSLFSLQNSTLESYLQDNQTLRNSTIAALKEASSPFYPKPGYTLALKSNLGLEKNRDNSQSLIAFNLADLPAKLHFSNFWQLILFSISINVISLQMHSLHYWRRCSRLFRKPARINTESLTHPFKGRKLG